MPPHWYTHWCLKILKAFESYAAKYFLLQLSTKWTPRLFCFKGRMWPEIHKTPELFTMLLHFNNDCGESYRFCFTLVHARQAHEHCTLLERGKPQKRFTLFETETSSTKLRLCRLCTEHASPSMVGSSLPGPRIQVDYQLERSANEKHYGRLHLFQLKAGQIPRPTCQF